MTDETAMGPEEPWLIVARGPVGNCAVFWRHAGQGYTCELDDAGHYSKAAALRQEADRPGVDVAVPLRLAVEHSERHVRWGPLMSHAQKRRSLL